MYLKQLEVGNFSVFAYLLAGENGGDGLVIDPAGDVDQIVALAKKDDIRIQFIVNTHAHVDHVMGNEAMKNKTGAQIIIHEEDAPLLTRTSRSMFSMFGGQPSPPADRTVKDGDLIQVGQHSLMVLHTPGHSPGGISLLEQGMVFTGDSLFAGSIGRTDLPGGDLMTLIRSIKTNLMTLPDDTQVFCGRGPATTIGEERKENPFLNAESGFA